mgnify:CR=1 FL=1
MKRKIISIDEEKCNGCGLCVNACHEGAIELVDGKARLVSDEYCDGLGDCLPECPTGAIEMIEKDTVAYDEEAVHRRMDERKGASVKSEKHIPCGCPGTASRMLGRMPEAAGASAEIRDQGHNSHDLPSELRQWPVQLSLINTRAEYLKNADLLIAADCTAYAYAGFHRDFMKGRITIIGCPKLDDNEYYRKKLAEILRTNSIKSITVVRMQVPCCGGIVSAVKSAMIDSQIIVPYSEVIITPDGSII